MTPKDKAEELIMKYKDSVNDYGFTNVRDIYSARHCGIIAVDEIIEALKYDFNNPTSGSVKYWQQVRKELEAM